MDLGLWRARNVGESLMLIRFSACERHDLGADDESIDMTRSSILL